MTREHAPRPGVTWETAVRRDEHLVLEDDEPSTATPDHLRPGPPPPNRAARRAAARTARRRKDT